MIQNVVDFFKNLPPKICTNCGDQVAEQHECYGTTCDKCTKL
ncbi:protein YhfH [Bacillus sp. FSL K6-3431]